MKVGDTFKPDYDDCKLKTVFSIPAKQQKFATINAETGEITAKAKGNVTVTAIVGEGKMARKVTAKIKINS